MPAEDTEKKNPSTKRRDDLLKWQSTYQAVWEQEKIFEASAPAEGQEPPKGKFFGNFPYPYMNGLLHLGHAFSLSKLEFACAYHRLEGKQVLFPQGFHCTGMPIKACADKLNNEIQQYGCPPRFPSEEPVESAAAPEGEGAPQPTDPTKFSGKKSKATAKKGAGNTQWDILKLSGIPEAEIPSFRSTDHWLKYFPPQAKRDIKAMGCGVDWRRSFITTGVNPYYDSFIRWQFEVLRRQGKIVKDKRLAVYSPKDGQPCADHDRATGEGVGPQDYTLIKLQALELPGKLAALQGKGTVYLMAATLRPETMYGQTNCWALPEGDYGAYQGRNNEVYIMAARSARNLSYQDKLPVEGHAEELLQIKGQDLIGVPLKAPNSPLARVYVLPLLTISMGKGTGIVTSVPSDAPDDYIALLDLKRKDKLREKFGVKDEWVLPFEVIPIINIPGFGDRAAEKVCTDLKIQSQNDREKLDEAKKQVYLKGFTEGVLTVGPHAGKKVSEVKAVIRQEMLQAGQAMPYSEPEKQVMSRSGDVCVVALTDQWYLNYGEDEWREATRQCLDDMTLYHEETKRGFEYTLGWLRQWACSRSFGLGTRLPWDPQYLIESLSDSTIYMAYYTVAHLLQSNMYGTSGSSTDDSPDPAAEEPAVKPEDLTSKVWDYIFLEGPEPKHSAIPAQTLDALRREFEYWYPFDLRTSGKDLINNHLSFALYNHTAIWQKDPSKWPRSIRTNGHLLLNAEKMSKSTGNFKTLEQAIQEYSADAMRLALADAGDALDDANFEHTTANGAILRLTKEVTWVEEMIREAGTLRTGSFNFADRVFQNDIYIAIEQTEKNYKGMLFREALKTGCYNLQQARDSYRELVGGDGRMHHDLFKQYAKVATLLLTPICPHTCEHMWRDVLGHRNSALTAGFPKGETTDFALLSAREYLSVKVSALLKLRKAASKGKVGVPQHLAGGTCDLYVADKFDGWQAVALNVLASAFDAKEQTFAATWEKDLIEAVKASRELKDLDEKKLRSKVNPFANAKVKEAKTGGAQVLGVKLPFDEAALLRENEAYIREKVGVSSVSVHEASQAAADARQAAAEEKQAAAKAKRAAAEAKQAAAKAKQDDAEAKQAAKEVQDAGEEVKQAATEAKQAAGIIDARPGLPVVLFTF